MFAIHVVVSSDDLRSSAELAATALNAVQSEFYFRVEFDECLPGPLRQDVVKSSDAFAGLEIYRGDLGTSVPYLIAVVKGRLETETYSNAFGSHRRNHGLVILTTYGTEFVIQDTVRYLRYYLARYAISMAAPSIRGHAPGEPVGCLFDRKEDKTELWASLRTGALCQEHKAILLNAIKAREMFAVEQMCRRVADDLPRAAILKGGGVKGLALIGAMRELEPYYKFDTYAGTSAGSILAVLLGAGASLSKLEADFLLLDFKCFLDRGLKRRIINIFSLGLHSGQGIEDWVQSKLREIKPTAPDNLKLSDLPMRVVAYANASGLIRFDKCGDRASTEAAFVARCSSSIPIFFTPQRIDGRRAFDGGLRANFPVKEFVEANPNKPFLGFCLVSRGRVASSFIGQLMDSVVTGDEPDTVRKYERDIVVIDTSPIGTTDFVLGRKEKLLLLMAGKLSAMRYLAEFRPDDSPSSQVLIAAEAEHATLRKDVEQIRRRRRTTFAVANYLVVSIAGVLLIGGRLHWSSWLVWSGAAAIAILSLIVRRIGTTIGI